MFGIVGLDEAGRGPLAGPVVAAAVQLDPDLPLVDGLNDSKKISAAHRERLFDEIQQKATAVTVAEASIEEIDRINILQASLRAMFRALQELTCEWNMALVDGNQYIREISGKQQMTVIGGDGLSASIAAASIVAKVTRDRTMKNYHKQFPQWEFDRHKGYPTKRHKELILAHGLCPIHRKSFCERLVLQMSLAI
ncbi:MAG: ribonuclease HII [Chitinivibrionales bacterium]|nr:ribonuclease HII [Chitinivibrionales bacterium]